MYNLMNYTEIIVDDTLDKILSTYENICTCDKCKLDIKALALNSLPNRYIVTKKGEIFKKMDELNQQLKVDAVAAVTTAIEKVSVAPQHEE
ncbi:MAG: late competence development ComFB family protein [Clostridiaceae bacterium]